VISVLAGARTPDTVTAQTEGQEYPREAIDRVFGDVAAVPGFHRYLARVDGVAAGGASMREFDRVAQLCGVGLRCSTRGRCT